MAAESVVNVFIRVRNELRDDLKRIRKDLGDIGEGLQALNAAGSGQGLDDAAGNLRDINNSLTGLPQKMEDSARTSTTLFENLGRLTNVVRALVAGFTSFIAVRFVSRATEIAGRAEVLGTVLNVVGTNAGFATKQLDELTQAVAKQGITLRASRESLIQLIQAQIISSQEAGKAAELARAAQDLAVVTGQNSSETLRRLAINIQQLDTVGLRWMGLMVDRNQGEREFAALLGKSASSLTLIEKRQAFLNSTLKEAAKLSGTYEASLSNVEKQQGSLARYQEEFSRVIGEPFLPAKLALVEEFTELLKNLTAEFQGGFSDGSTFAEDFAKAVKTGASALREIIEFVVEWRVQIVTLIAAFAFKNVFDALSRWGASMVPVIASTRAATVATEAMAAQAAVAAETYFTMALAMASAARNTVELAAAQRVLALATTEATVAQGRLALATNVSSGAFTAFLGRIGAGRIVETVAKFSGLRNVVTGVGVALRGLTFALPLLGQLAAAAFTAYTVWQLWKGEAEETDEALEDSLRSQAETILKRKQELDDQIKKLEQTLEQAKARELAKGTDADFEFIEKIRKQLEALQKQSKDTAKEYADFVKEIEDGDLKEELGNLPRDRQVLANQIREQFTEAKKAVEESRKNLGLDKLKITPDFVITQEFDAKLTGVRTLIDQVLNPPSALDQVDARIRALTVTAQDYERRVAATGDRQDVKKLQEIREQLQELDRVKNEVIEGRLDLDPVNVSIEELRVGLEKLAEGAKGPDEIAAAMATIRDAAKETNLDFEALLLTLQQRFDTTALQDVNKEVGAFQTRLQSITEVYRLYRQIVNDSVERTASLSRVFAQFGAAVPGVSDALTLLRRDLSRFNENSTAVVGIDIAKLDRDVEAARALYNDDVNNLEQVNQQKIALINQSISDEGSRFQKLRALNEQYTKEVLDRTREQYQFEADQLRQREAAVAASLRRLADLDKSNNQLEVDRIETIRDLRRQLLSEDQQLADKRRELNELEGQQELAILQRNFEEAERLGRRRLQLAQDVFREAGAQDDVAGQRRAILEVDDAYKALQQTNRAQRREAEDQARQQIDAYNRLKASVESFAQTLSRVAGQRFVDLTTRVDNTALQDAVREVENAFKNLVIKVKVEPDNTSGFNVGGLVRRATGGIVQTARAVFNSPLNAVRAATGRLIKGPGSETSDNILALLSNFEFVHRAAAVRYYGEPFMNAINELRIPKEQLPKFAGGGPVRSLQPIAQSDIGRRDVIDFNLTIGGKRMTLMGERREVEKTIDALKGLETTR